MSLSRRAFVRNLSVTGGGMVLGFHLTLPGQAAEGADLTPNAFLRITPAGEIIVQIHKVEMGQGSVTGMTSLIAEELEVDPGAVRYEMAQVDKAFRDPEYYLQITGGSNATRVNYEPLRRTGAAAREMLLQAAANRTGLSQDQLYCDKATVRSRDGSTSLAYNELVTDAAQLRVPRKPALKQPADFKVIGKQNARLDNQPKVDGTATFGIDAPLPEALVAVVRRPPVTAGPVVSFDDSKARGLPGVHKVVQIESGVAVVASNYWRARKAAEALQLEWQSADSELTSSAAIAGAMDRALDGDKYTRVQKDGREPRDQSGLLALEADYSLPFLAHATMEPMNATVDPDTLEVWVGSQAPDLAQKFAALGLGVDADEVTVHNQFLGGGFGRRAVPDDVFEAAQIARAVGRRVKLVWSREDDTRHDYYRPAMKSRLKALLDDDGKVVSWQHRLAGPNLMQSFAQSLSPAVFPSWVPDALVKFGAGIAGRFDDSSVEGATDLPYGLPHIEVGYTNVQTPVRLGYWRSVGHSHTAFVVESFVDELAHAANTDPLEFRRQYLPENSRHREVLDKVAEISHWGNAPEGRFQGVAVHESFHSVVAEVVEVSMENGTAKLEKAYCAIHCGRAINPDIVHQQLEGGMLFGLTAALKGEITLKDGAVEQGNFHDYPVLRMNEAPEVIVAIVDSDAPPTGVGEPATPPAPAALANALFAATGKRQRSLPLQLG